MHWLLSGRLSVEKITVKIADLPVSLAGTKLVQMSDFHDDGKRLSEEMLEQAIAITNAAEADLILLTGDYITTNPSPIHHLASRLKNLQSRYGIYAILGNHDIYYKHPHRKPKTPAPYLGIKPEIIAAFENIGIHVLWNQIAYPLGEKLPIIGLADYWSEDFQPASVMEKIDPKIPRIVLSHNPDTAEILQQWRVDLQLSGHTHGGQIVIPGVGTVIPFYNKAIIKIPRQLRRLIPFFPSSPIKVIQHWEWTMGLHQVGNNQLYVNRGLGTYAPGRLFCPPEVTIITLL
ncbi:metallophosphoesterase [Calothrix sp. 336/3]|uniref:metallophosphoesterase n=1 Tax=Calothrix sp. 336/3 TaxID=1337936 RepID=UPI0004E38845|nr:metallophosphoesterase [Calothrix sp. 336/3]AKG20132.1 metallophosphatase [Calothrix sp. 336/3]